MSNSSILTLYLQDDRSDYLIPNLNALITGIDIHQPENLRDKFLFVIDRQFLTPVGRHSDDLVVPMSSSGTNLTWQVDMHPLWELVPHTQVDTWGLQLGTYPAKIVANIPNGLSSSTESYVANQGSTSETGQLPPTIQVRFFWQMFSSMQSIILEPKPIHAHRNGYQLPRIDRYVRRFVFSLPEPMILHQNFHLVVDGITNYFQINRPFSECVLDLPGGEFRDALIRIDPHKPSELVGLFIGESPVYIYFDEDEPLFLAVIIQYIEDD